jgi:CrcB protein
MQLELLKMLDRHDYSLAAGYAGGSVAAGYCAVWLTTAAVRRTRVLA